MSEPDSTLEIKHFGLKPGQIAEKDALVRSVQKELDQEKTRDAMSVKLSESEKKRLKQAELLTRKYFTEKHERILSANNPLLLPEVIYTPPTIGEHNVTLGAYTSGSRVATVAIDRLRDLLSTATLAAHELGHASGKQQWRLQWSEGELMHFIDIVGLDRRNLKQRFFAGVENGLNLMDQVDIYYLYHQRIFPYEARLRVKAANNEPVVQQVAHLDATVFGPIKKDQIAPFISSVELHQGRQKRPKKIVRIDTDPIKNYRFIQEVCRTLGFVESQKSRQVNNENEKLIQIGRDMLERDRYAGTTASLRDLVHIFGKDRARLLFSVDDHYNHLDEAMQAVRDTQNELGIYRAIPNNS